MKKALLSLIMAVFTMLMAESTVIYVNGNKITGTTNFTTGGGTVTYNENTKLLTIDNCVFSRSGSDNNAIENEDVAGLKIRFTGTNSMTIHNASALALRRTTTLNVASGTTTIKTTAGNQNAIGLYNSGVFITGNGTLNLISTQSRGIQGREGASDCFVFFSIKNCTIDSYSNNFYDLRKVSFYVGTSYGDDDYTTKITLKSIPTYAAAHGGNISDWYADPTVKVLTPEYGMSLSNLGKSAYSTSEFIITDIPVVAIINETNFPDAHFRNYLLALYPSGYITTMDVDSRTSLNVGAKSISSLQGVGYFSKLTTLICSGNYLTSLPELPSTLTTLGCTNNQITSLPTLPSGLLELACGTNKLTSLPTLPNNLQKLYCGGNKFITLNISGKGKLHTLDVSNNTSLTSLVCRSDALTTLNYNGCTVLNSIDCSSNKLTSLAAVPSSVTTFNCASNQLSSLPSLPSGLQELNCSTNKLTALSLQGKNSLTKLEIHGNQIKESAMGSLVNSLRTIPTGSTGEFKVIGDSGEGNEISTQQVTTARNKRWLPMKKQNGNWVEITTSIPGDVDGDGIVTSVDITALYNYLLNGDSSSIVNGDQDGDGTITSVDVTIIYNILLGN
ncbi:MAG: hypothetical protein IKX31_08955 [Muribaculaceae bacterium]|nr:hypothetical protein [Muribaculaceae bacterium]